MKSKDAGPIARDVGLERLLAGITATVFSRSDGNMAVRIVYGAGLPGFPGRLAIGAEFEALVNQRIAKARRAVGKKG